MKGETMFMLLLLGGAAICFTRRRSRQARRQR